MEISIKNMVCPRCIRSVAGIARECNLKPSRIELGKCVFEDQPDEETFARFKALLEADGFEILSSREDTMVTKIKTALVDLVYNHAGDIPTTVLSDYLQNRLNTSYSHIRCIFPSLEGRSIENYFISLRIERVKELVRYDELTLSEIADQLGYSYAAHLSAQFKKVTGLTPTQFKNNLGERKSLDLL